MTTIRKLFDKAYAAARDRSYTRGILGDPDGNVRSSTRPEFAFVRVSQEGRQSVTLAKHLGRVPLRAGLPVRMLFENGVFVIEGVDSFYYDAATSADTANPYGVPAHTHALDSGLTYLLEAMRMQPGLVRPLGGWTVAIESFRYLSGSTWETYPGTTTLSLLANRPATSGKHRLAIVTVDPATNTASVVNGSEEDYATTLDQASIDAISIGTKIPLAAVRIRADDTTINVQSRFIDARGWLNLGGVGSLAGLADVDLDTPAPNDILLYGGGSKWVNAPYPTIPENLEDLADTNFTALDDGHSLIYNLGSNQWINVAMLLSMLFDVDFDTLTDGQTMRFDGGDEVWRNVDPDTVVAGGAFGDLSNVILSAEADRDVPVYDSGDWVNRHTGRTLITDWSFRDNTGLSTSSYAWKGNRFTPDVDVDIYAMCYFGTIVGNGVYQAAVITGSGSPGNIATVTKSATYTAASSPASLTGGHMWLEFSSPVRLTAGTQYGLMVGRTDAGGTYQLPVAFNGGAIPSNAVPMPGLSHGAGWRCDDATLTVGSAINQQTGNSMACGFRFRFPDSVY